MLVPAPGNYSDTKTFLVVVAQHSAGSWLRVLSPACCIPPSYLLCFDDCQAVLVNLLQVGANQQRGLHQGPQGKV